MIAAAVASRIVRERPAFHSAQGEARVWNALPGTLDMIGRLVQRGDRTLELGSGASTVMFLAAGARHTAVSPHGAEHQAIREYCLGIGVDGSEASFIEGFSDQVLPTLPESDRFDAAFIDGAHSFPYPVVDWHYVSRRLRVGGVLMMDDVPIPAAELVYRFMCQDPAWELIEVVDDRAAAFRKAAEPPLGDNWRLQRFNRRYPDYSFLSAPARARAEVRHRAAKLRGAAAKRLKRRGHAA